MINTNDSNYHLIEMLLIIFVGECGNAELWNVGVEKLFKNGTLLKKNQRKSGKIEENVRCIKGVR